MDQELIDNIVTVSTTAIFDEQRIDPGPQRANPFHTQHFRIHELARNGILLFPSSVPLPNPIRTTVDEILSGVLPAHPEMQHVDHNNDWVLQAIQRCAAEVQMLSYFSLVLFPRIEDAFLGTVWQQAIPVESLSGDVLMPAPVPDIMYGYKSLAALQANPVAILFNDPDNFGAYTRNDFLLPFLTIKFAPDGPQRVGSLWAATNECMAASAACNQIFANFYQRLAEVTNLEYRHAAIPFCFGIIMNTSEARLLCSFRTSPSHHFTKEVHSWLIHRPDDFLALRNSICSILHWGQEVRLRHIYDDLEALAQQLQ